MRMDRPSVSAIEGRASEDPNEVFAPRRRLSCGVSTKNPLHRLLAVQTALKDGRIALYGCAFDGKPEGWQTAIPAIPFLLGITSRYPSHHILVCYIKFRGAVNESWTS